MVTSMGESRTPGEAGNRPNGGDKPVVWYRPDEAKPQYSARHRLGRHIQCCDWHITGCWYDPCCRDCPTRARRPDGEEQTGGSHRRPPALWAPCREGYPDPEHCPRCTPPEEERCPDRLFVGYGGWPGNDAGYGLTERWATCRVLGPHDVHRDGMGRSWYPAD